MSPYYFIFLWIGIMAVLQSNGYFERYELVGPNIKGKRWGVVAAFIVIIPLIYLTAFTHPQGDVPGYLHSFHNLRATPSNLYLTIANHESGWGFIVFEIVEKMLFGDNESVFRLILSLVHIVPIILVFRRYSTNYLISILLFCLCGNHIAWMMNGLRQFMAVSLIFASTPWILDKKNIRCIAVILIATTIHTSALVMLPVIIAAQGEPWNKKTLCFLILTILASYVFSVNLDAMDILLENTEYANVASNYANWGDDGINPIRVLVNSVPFLLSAFGKDIFDARKSKIIAFSTNMSIITTGIYCVGMVTNGIMVGRVPIYMSMYNLVLLPYLVNGVFKGKSRKIISILMIFFYMLYYVIQYGGFI